MSKHNISILVIDDVSKVFEGLRERLSIVSAPYRVIEYLVDTTKKKETVICEIADIINNESITHIISDRGFSVVENCEETKQVLKKSNGIEFQKIDDLIENIVENLSENSIKQIKSFIIYSYDPFSNEIRREFRILRANLAKKVSDKLGVSEKELKDRIKTIESSSIYKRPGRTGIYPNRDKKDPLIGSFQACKFYGEFLADVLVNIIVNERIHQEGRIDPYSYSKPQNYEMLKQIRSLEDLITNKDISIGSVSCYGNIYGKEEYLVDVPYKSYYDNINKEITRVSEIDGKSDLSLIFYNNLDKKQGFVKYEYVYFKYSVFEEDAILLDDIKLSAGLKKKDIICKQWLPLLHSSVFFCQENTWKNDLLKSNNKPASDPISFVNIFFSIIKLEEDDFHGTYNFTLYSENPDINFEKFELYAYEKYAPLVESKLLELILPHKSKESKKQAIRAAISQVMARNMSHNIGSHVMNKLIDSVYLEKFCSYSNCLKSYKPVLDFKETIDHTAFKQLAIYNNYVKCRMDYLSDMSFGTPLMQTSKKIHGDAFKELDKVRLLLENISGLSDNFKYCIKLELIDDSGEVTSINSENDFALAIPNDVLGCQAFYNIVENVIRNTAKHAVEKPEITTFTIRFSEIDEENVVELTKQVKDEPEGLMCVEIFDNVPVEDIHQLVKGQNEKLNNPILNESNQLRSNSLGLIEMEASAAYLRKLDSYSIDEEEYVIENGDQYCNSKGKLNVLKAVKVGQENMHCLGYRFFMLKPQEVLIVYNGELSEEKKNALKKEGVWVINKEDFIAALFSGAVFNHAMLVHDNTAEMIQVLNVNSTSLPLRQIQLAEEVEVANLLLLDGKKIIESCWEKYAKIIDLKYETGFYLPNVGGKYADFANHDDGLLAGLRSNSNFYFDGLSSNAQNKLPGFKTNLTEYYNSLRNDIVNKTKIGESIVSKILVIDERVQQACSKTYIQQEITYEKLYQKTGIIVPDSNIPERNLSAKNISKKMFEDDNEYVKQEVKKLNKLTDFVLIHYSLLERIYQNDQDKDEKINAYLDILSNIANVVVTSGRGTLKGLTPNVRFINLSPVINAFVDLRSKYLSNYILHSSRKSQQYEKSIH